MGEAAPDWPPLDARFAQRRAATEASTGHCNVTSPANLLSGAKLGVKACKEWILIWAANSMWDEAAGRIAELRGGILSRETTSTLNLTKFSRPVGICLIFSLFIRLSCPGGPVQ